MSHQRITRGYGVLEGFLAQQRSRVANALIPASLRAGRLLDIGCGAYPLFLTQTRFARKFGLDKHVATLAASLDRDGHSTLQLIRYDVEHGGHLPFRDDRFSVVTMLAVFEHIEIIRLVALLSEVRRILQPGGRLVLTTPTKIAHSLLRGMAKAYLVSPIEIAEHKTCLSLAEILHVIEQAGFASSHAAHGYFELYLNHWLSVVKGGASGGASATSSSLLSVREKGV
ncbi:MAG: methyltransferase domain-containing protein [Nitrospira sp.]